MKKAWLFMLAALLACGLLVTGCGDVNNDDGGVVKTALTIELQNAANAKAPVVVNTDAANVATGTKWVTQAVMDTFTTAIASAQGVLADKAATQTAVDKAVADLKAATKTFTEALQDGTGEITMTDFPEAAILGGTTFYAGDGVQDAGSITKNGDSYSVTIKTRDGAQSAIYFNASDFAFSYNYQLNITLPTEATYKPNRVYAFAATGLGEVGVFWGSAYDSDNDTTVTSPYTGVINAYNMGGAGDGEYRTIGLYLYFDAGATGEYTFTVDTLKVGNKHEWTEPDAELEPWTPDTSAAPAPAYLVDFPEADILAASFFDNDSNTGTITKENDGSYTITGKSRPGAQSIIAFTSETLAFSDNYLVTITLPEETSVKPNRVYVYPATGTLDTGVTWNGGFDGATAPSGKYVTGEIKAYNQGGFPDAAHKTVGIYLYWDANQAAGDYTFKLSALKVAPFTKAFPKADVLAATFYNGTDSSGTIAEGTEAAAGTYTVTIKARDGAQSAIYFNGTDFAFSDHFILGITLPADATYKPNRVYAFAAVGPGENAVNWDSAYDSGTNGPYTGAIDVYNQGGFTGEFKTIGLYLYFDAGATGDYTFTVNTIRATQVDAGGAKDLEAYTPSDFGDEFVAGLPAGMADVPEADILASSIFSGSGVTPGGTVKKEADGSYTVTVKVRLDGFNEITIPVTAGFSDKFFGTLTLPETTEHKPTRVIIGASKGSGIADWGQSFDVQQADKYIAGKFNASHWGTLAAADPSYSAICIDLYWGPDETAGEYTFTLNTLKVKPAAPTYGKQADGTYTLDPTKFIAWYGASFGSNNATFDVTEGGVWYLFPTTDLEFNLADYAKLLINYTTTTSAAGISVKVLGTGDTYGSGYLLTDIVYPTLNNGAIIIQDGSDWYGGTTTTTHFTTLKTNGLGFGLTKNSDTFNMTVTALTLSPAAP
ncbi:MAG: hypothetical protein LBS97_01340 [Treponema sp.]|jgi:hypothetical protein|nr:hypothetical protein [Treponema sp.]